MGYRTRGYDLPYEFEGLKEREYTGGSKDGQGFDVRGVANFGFRKLQNAPPVNSSPAFGYVANPSLGDLPLTAGFESDFGSHHTSSAEEPNGTAKAICVTKSSTCSDGNVVSSAVLRAPPVPASRTCRKASNADMLTFLLQKQLRPSDVGNLGRIILPKGSSHHLQERDRLILYRNQRGNYVLRGKKKVHSESRGGASVITT